jgi:hypothetical protein
MTPLPTPTPTAEPASSPVALNNAYLVMQCLSGAATIAMIYFAVDGVLARRAAAQVSSSLFCPTCCSLFHLGNDTYILNAISPSLTVTNFSKETGTFTTALTTAVNSLTAAITANTAAINSYTAAINDLPGRLAVAVATAIAAALASPPPPGRVLDPTAPPPENAAEAARAAALARAAAAAAAAPPPPPPPKRGDVSRGRVSTTLSNHTEGKRRTQGGENPVKNTL